MSFVEKLKVFYESLRTNPTRSLPVLALAALSVFLAYRLKQNNRIKNTSKLSVLITGCDTGFGKGTTLRLAEKGLTVFAGCLTQTGVDDLVNKDNVIPFLLDVTKEESVQAAFQFVSQKLAEKNLVLWTLINNAGLLRGGELELSTPEDWTNTFEVNVLGVARMGRIFFPLIRQAKGRIINIASVAGRLANPGLSAYSASKFAVEGLSDSWRREMAKWGVTVVIVEPGIMKTNLYDAPLKNSEVDTVFNRLTEEQKDRYGRDYFETALKKSKQLIDRMGGDPKQVVDVLEEIVFAVRPKIRYPVGADTKYWLSAARLPAWLCDYLLNLLNNAKPRALK